MLEQPPASPVDASAPETDATREGRFHTYVTDRIPWYVRFIWLLFWIFAVAYVIRYLFPALQVEISNPP
ncbi:MAG: hypothetical protein JNL18_25120 [Planctomycetaceae bacterium]|jgi:hypothetical protein|uniref:Uncharacterized protein n=1 Tax=Lacipirellula limnantheis TaxID=2528024 RepID=A0A517U289_9BACT|nr:hypothetical protein [Lacipirellula limnantheis]MBL9166027.1 hypothetical protein [Planctomycetaceae bacterium]QDT74746.1 hypothetical protein I41_39450 [Lacipirellula limnantheis]